MVLTPFRMRTTFSHSVEKDGRPDEEDPLFIVTLIRFVLLHSCSYQPYSVTIHCLFFTCEPRSFVNY